MGSVNVRITYRDPLNFQSDENIVASFSNVNDAKTYSFKLLDSILYPKIYKARINIFRNNKPKDLLKDDYEDVELMYISPQLLNGYGDLVVLVWNEGM